MPGNGPERSNGTNKGAMSSEDWRRMNDLCEQTAKTLEELSHNGKVFSDAWVALRSASADGSRFFYLNVINWPVPLLEELLKAISRGEASGDPHGFLDAYRYRLPINASCTPRDIFPFSATPRVKNPNGRPSI